MANTILIKRGLSTNLPGLNTGEFGYCTDTKQVFIGTNNTVSGNLLVGKEIAIGGSTPTDASVFWIDLNDASENGEIRGSLNVGGMLRVNASITIPSLNNGATTANQLVFSPLLSASPGGMIFHLPSGNRFYFKQFSKNTASNAYSSYYEDFMLPATTSDRTSNATYNILTDKSLVTLAQGGTGSNNAAGARTALSTFEARVTSGQYQIVPPNGGTGGIRGTAGGFLPSANNTGSVGSSSERFAEVHATKFYESGVDISTKYSVPKVVSSNQTLNTAQLTSALTNAYVNADVTMTWNFTEGDLLWIDNCNVKGDRTLTIIPVGTNSPGIIGLHGGEGIIKVMNKAFSASDINTANYLLSVSRAGMVVLENCTFTTYNKNIVLGRSGSQISLRNCSGDTSGRVLSLDSCIVYSVGSMGLTGNTANSIANAAQIFEEVT